MATLFRIVTLVTMSRCGIATMVRIAAPADTTNSKNRTCRRKSYISCQITFVVCDTLFFFWLLRRRQEVAICNCLGSHQSHSSFGWHLSRFVTCLPEAFNEQQNTGGDERAANAQKSNRFLLCRESLCSFIGQCDEKQQRRLDKNSREKTDTI